MLTDRVPNSNSRQRCHCEDMSHESRHLPRKPLINKTSVSRLLAFLLLFISIAAVYFVIKTAPRENEDAKIRSVTPKYYSKLEGVQPEERDVFRDFRTSFIPPEELAVPLVDFDQRSKRNTRIPVLEGVESRRIGGKSVLSSGTDILSLNGELDPQRDGGADGGSEGRGLDDERSPGDYDDTSDDDDYYDEEEQETSASISNESLGAGASRGVDRGPLDDVVEQVRGQPELEEGELGDAPHLSEPARRYKGIHAFWKGQGDKETIRRTQARIMGQYMDRDADPCEDFFQYACGNWPALNPIPADKAGYDTFEMLRENLDAVLKDMLEFQPGENHPSQYPGPKLDLYNDFLEYAKTQKTLEKPEPETIKNKPASFNSIGNDGNLEDFTTETPIVMMRNTIQIYFENSNSSQSTDKNVVDQTKNAELLHRIRRYLGQNKMKSRQKLKSKYFQNDEILKKVKNNQIKRTEREYRPDEEKNNSLYRKGRRLKRFKRESKVDITIGRDIIEKPFMDQDKDPAEGDAALKARFLFKSCMNYEILQKRGHQPLLDLLDLLGGWPILRTDWNSSNFDWLELMAKLRLYNNDILISEWVGPDIKNSDEFVIQFDQTSLGLPTRDYFLQDCNKAYLQAYKEYLITIALLLGGSRDQVLKSANELIQFETRLASITSAPEDRRNVSELYRRMSVRRLEAILPGVQWRRYLCIVMNRTVDPDETVVLFAFKYARNLVRLVNQTDASTLSNYLMWRFVRHRVNNLDDRFQTAKQQFYNILFGREQSPPRWKNCISQVNSNMGMALGSMFVQKYFDETSKNDTLTMTREIQKSFRELLHLTDWIDDDTKTLAAHKVDAMMLRIGYPDFILNKKELDDRYHEVRIHPDKYFENILNILQHLTKMEQARLGQPVNKTLWNTAPAVVNAYYSRNKNQIMFPAGILQPPFYHRHFPRSLNYGGIGVVIGHEITHGFDDKGRLFDCDGNLHRWWSDSAIEAFHRRAQCLIDQYARYTVPEVNVKLDGINTQGENIADNGGVKQAFRAYLRWLEHNDAGAETLPGLNHTNTQLFFLNFAQVWCGAMRPEAMRNKLKTAVHSPGRFRVIGALSNSEDFAHEFACAPGTPMNPRQKCSVW